MKPGPIAAMVVLLFVGMWLVLQPSLSRGSRYEVELRIGAEQLRANQLLPGEDPGAQATGAALYAFVEPPELAAMGPVSTGDFDRVVAERIAAWEARPALERHLLGFFNITSWGSFVWVVVGLVGQSAFFGRMFIQWIVSEKSRQSQVPELFWWLSLAGGLCLFTYFVWRVDVVGVLGQSMGVVIYARNLRLIHKHKRRSRRAAPDAPASPARDSGVPGAAPGRSPS